MIRALIVDDERLARRGLALRLQGNPAVEVIGECATAADALAAIEEDCPDVLFLDIAMPGESGLELAARLTGDGSPLVVFVTAYDRHAVAAFERAAVDYLLKPVTRERLEDALGRVSDRLGGQKARAERGRLLKVLREVIGRPDLDVEEALARLEADSTLVIQDGGQLRRVPVGEIRVVTAAGDYMCVTTGEDTYVIRETLAELTRRLGPSGFLRIHRSTLVNGRLLRAFRPNDHGDGWVELADGTELRCSRTYRPEVEAALQRS